MKNIDTSQKSGTMETCEYCGRWLATVYSDGTADIAPKAAVIFGIGTTPGEYETTGHAIPGTAICYRWRCRWERWWRNE